MAYITDISLVDVSPRARLVMHFLGPPQILIEGISPTGLHKSQKPLVLLAYLAMRSDRPHQRGHLAALFWPDHTERRALQNLRQTLSRLRRALDDTSASPPHILVDAHTVQFNRRSDYWLDVEIFQQIMKIVRAHPHRRLAVCSMCVELLSHVESIYQGEFLAEISGGESPLLAEWLLLTREHLAYQARMAFLALAEAYLLRDNVEGARRCARRLVDMDPWNEEAQRLLIRVLLRSEGRNAALRHFRSFARRLQRELGVEPEDATLALVRRIESGEPKAHLISGIEGGHSPLPVTPTTFVGREREQSLLETWLAHRDRRLITVYGPGGVGKTRLVLEVAARQQPLWKDGIYFVPLSHAHSTSALDEILATTFHLNPQPGVDLPTYLLNYLRDRELLLILDSFEFLLGSDGRAPRPQNLKLVADILRRAPAVKILVTSRVRLGLQGEWELRLDGLAVPENVPSSAEDAAHFHSLELFLHRARQAVPHFTLTDDNLPHVVRICRAVGGLPLGIELAAARVHHLPLAQMAQEIERSLDFLQSSQPDLPRRQHSLRATFEHSYALLPPHLQRVLRGLAVFQGGFTVEAACSVLDASVQDLMDLQGASLIHPITPERFDIHPALQPYVDEIWRLHPHERERALNRHARHFLRSVASYASALYGASPQDALNLLELERDNIRHAWQWAVAQGQDDLLALALDGMVAFFEIRGPLAEGERLFREAADHLGARHPLAGRLRAEAARFLDRQGEYTAAAEAASEALTLAHHAHDRRARAVAAYILGNALWHQGVWDEAEQHLLHALEDARAGDMPMLEVEVLRALAGTAWRQHDYARARAYLERALSTHIEHPHMLSAVLHNLGVVAIEQGDYSRARQYYERSLALREQIGDRRGVGMLLTNLGNFYLYLGQYEEAKQYYRRSLSLLQEIGERWAECIVLGNLGLVHHYLGDQELAERYARYAVRLAQRIGDKPTEATMWMKLAHALAAQQRWQEAQDAYQRSFTLRQEVGQTTLAMESLAGLARVALHQGHVDTAVRHVEVILEHVRDHPLDGTIDPFLIHWTCYRVLETVHDSRAHTVLEHAYIDLKGRSQGIEEPALRETYLTRVASHRWIVEAWQRRAQK